MVSPELLRRYPFFSGLEDSHLKAIAMLTQEASSEKGKVIFEGDQPASILYFLIEGSVELHYIVVDKHNPQFRKDFYVGEINPGEPFGISAMIEPFCYTATAIASNPCRILQIEAGGLRSLCEEESGAAAVLMRQIARAVMTRLHETRVQLAAARA